MKLRRRVLTPPWSTGVVQPRPASPDGSGQTAAPDVAPFPRGRFIPALDAVRGLAVLLVLVRHFTADFEPTTGAGETLQALARTGWYGVDLFFVLSGFLITGILLDSRGTPHYYRNFFARRTLRIFPLYYGVLAALFLVLPAVAALAGWGDALAARPEYAQLRDHQAWYWLYATNVLAAIHGFGALALNTTHFWSLAVEEQFYLVWPWVVARFGGTARALVRVCLGMVVASAVVRALLLAYDATPTAAYTLTPARLDALGAGALVAVLARDPRSWAALVRAAPSVVIIAGALLAATFVQRGGLEYRDAAVQVSGHALLAVAFSALVVLFIAPPRTAVVRWCVGLLDRPTLRWLGAYSYGIYVFHFPLQLLADRVLPPSELPALFGFRHPAHALYVLTLTAASAALAWASWHLFEKRFLALKRHFPSAGSPTHGPGEAPPAAPASGRQAGTASGGSEVVAAPA